MEIYSASYTEDGRIRCEIEHPTLGRIWYHADENDIEQFGKDTHALALAANPTPYVPPVPESPPADGDLSPPEFERLLRLSGLDDAWEALAAHLKTTDRVAYADLQGERDRSNFRLAYTLTKVALFRPVLTALSYDISDLTDANITTWWGYVIAERV